MIFEKMFSNIKKMPRSQNQTCNFVATQWNTEITEEEYSSIMERNEIRYLAYGEEVCPKSNRAHHQLFMCFYRKKSTGNRTLNQIGQMFGIQHCHVEPMYGSLLDNERYCSKSGIYHELGDKPSQGFRKDLVEICDEIKAFNTTAKDILYENPKLYHQYGRTFEALQSMVDRKMRRKWMTKGIWITGPTGCGKSYKAFHDYGDEYYVKEPNTKWWDNYNFEEVVIFNEFRGNQLNFSELLSLVDEHPKWVPQRCKPDKPFMAKTVIITSVMSPEGTYHGLTCDEPWEQFYRRFEIIKMQPRQALQGSEQE